MYHSSSDSSRNKDSEDQDQKAREEEKARKKSQQAREEYKRMEEQIKEQYELIADESDTELTAWQRIMRVNKLMLHFEIKNTIEKLIEPVFDSQRKIEIELLRMVKEQLTKMTDRVKILEDDVYNKETRDDRLFRLEQRLREEEYQRKINLQTFENELTQFRLKIDTITCLETTMNSKFTMIEEFSSDFRKQVEKLNEKNKQQQTALAKQLDQYVLQTNRTMKNINDRMDAIVHTHTHMSQIQNKIHENVILLQQQVKDQRDKQFELELQSTDLRINKTDLNQFQALETKVELYIKKNNLQVDANTNQVKDCSNYMEKYMPMYVQRQISDMIQYVIIDRQVRWRVNWYNEIKIPMITTGILLDNGNQSLNQKIDTLHELVTKNILPALPNDPVGMTPEEEFIAISLRNKQIHAKAKLIIMQMLDQIKNPDKQMPGVRGRVRDYTRATVTNIFNEMLYVLKKDNPQIVREMLLDGTIQADTKEEEVETQMDEDQDADQSLEAKITREVAIHFKECEKQLAEKLVKSEEHQIEVLKRMQLSSEASMNVRQDETQQYIKEIHNFQIMEMKNFKDCHKLYLASAQQFERKIQAVIGIENSNLQILKQMKALNEIVSEFSETNIAAFSGTELPKFNQQLLKTLSPRDQQLSQQLQAATSDQNSSDAINTIITASVMPISLIKNTQQKQIRRGAYQTLSVVSGFKTNDQEETTQHTKSFVGSRPLTQHRQTRNTSRLTTKTPNLLYQSTENRLEIVGNNDLITSIKGKGLLNDKSSVAAVNVSMRPSLDAVQNQNQQSRLSSAFGKLKQTATRNQQILGKMILDDDMEMAAEVARKAQIKAETKLTKKNILPSTQDFKQQIMKFKERVADTAIGDKFSKNMFADELNQHIRQVKPIQCDVGNDNKMTLGIRRKERDLDGNCFDSNPDTNSQIFKEGSNRDGTIDTFNRAAGLEHQHGKKWDELVFDKKAVIQSVKGFIS